MSLYEYINDINKMLEDAKKETEDVNEYFDELVNLFFY